MKSRLLDRLPSRGRRREELRVADAMTGSVISVAPEDSVRVAARRMAEREVAAVVVEGEPAGILTARDALAFVAAGRDADREQVIDHATSGARSTTPERSLDEAVATMTEGGFRHLVVVEEGSAAGVLGMRDVVRCWVDRRATPREPVPIRTAMSTDVIETNGRESVRQAAEAMLARGTGAVVISPGHGRPYPGLFTEREVAGALASGDDLDSARIADRLAPRMTFSAPGWSVKQAAEAMRKGGFQQIVVVDQHEIRGVIAIRDIVRAWMGAGE